MDLSNLRLKKNNFTKLVQVSFSEDAKLKPVNYFLVKKENNSVLILFYT